MWPFNESHNNTSQIRERTLRVTNGSTQYTATPFSMHALDHKAFVDFAIIPPLGTQVSTTLGLTMKHR